MRKIISKIAGLALGLSLAAGVGVSLASKKSSEAKAAESVVYTLTPATGSNNSYAGNCDVTVSGITWNVNGNAQQLPWRLGGKSLTGVDRTVYSKTKISDNVSKVELTHGAASSVTVNSVTVAVASDSSFNTVISTLTPTFAANNTVTINRPDGKDWSNAYYKFTYNLTISATKNKFLEFSGAKFYAESGSDPEVYTVTFDNQGHGTQPASQQITSGGTVTDPGNLSEDGWIFGGWYKDADCGIAWNFTSDTISGPTTIYAKWTEESADDDVLSFDLKSNPGGWPTQNESALTDYTYTLNAVSYTFKLKNIKQNSGYLMATSLAVLGLPSISGKKLTKVVASNSASCSTSTKVGISSDDSDSNYISGGEVQTWSAVSSEYSYYLDDTEEDTVYYLIVTNKNAQIINLKLTYVDAQSTGTQIKLSTPDIVMDYGDSPVAAVVKDADDTSKVISGCAFSSGTPSVADVVNGEVVAYAKGTSVITVSHADDTTDPENPITYKSTTFTVTVNELVSIQTVVTACKALGSSGTTAESYTIQGTVTGDYSSGEKKNYMIQQGSYGMYLYNTGVNLSVGDVARATGKFGRYNNWIESKELTSVVKVDAAPESISPVVITDLATLTDDYQNTLVTFQGLEFVSGTPGTTDTSINFKLGTSDLVLRTTVGIPDETNINSKLVEAADHKADSKFNLVGVHYTVFNSAKQFKVDNATKIQRTPNEATVTEIVQGFVDSCMHLSDIPVSEESRQSSTTACSATGGYYEVAKAALTSLGDEAIAEFKGNSIFDDAQERYESWAEIYGDATPYSEQFTPVSGSTHGIATNVDSNTSTIIIVVVALTSITSIGVLLVIKRKRSLVK